MFHIVFILNSICKISSKFYYNECVLCKTEIGPGVVLEIQNCKVLHDAFGARAPWILSFATLFAHVRRAPSASNTECTCYVISRPHRHCAARHGTGMALSIVL
jgi:hypothetical protein